MNTRQESLNNEPTINQLINAKEVTEKLNLSRIKTYALTLRCKILKVRIENPISKLVYGSNSSNTSPHTQS
jgi:hypothetical protein